MTDEQLKTAPGVKDLMPMLTEHPEVLTDLGVSQMTADVIKALQKDGQYIVFAAPVGYKFKETDGYKADDKFPSFSCLDHEVMQVTTGFSLAGVPGLRIVRTCGCAE